MQKDLIVQLVNSALDELKKTNDFPDVLPLVQVSLTKDKLHGDYATNIALLLAKELKSSPREVSKQIKEAIPLSPLVEKVEIAGPGFLNFFLSPSAHQAVIIDILNKKNLFGCSDSGKGRRALVEFVSSNPTGPLHVGHGRHGAYGSVVANLLQASGYEVFREYYVNDAGRQMDVLAVSVWLRYLAIEDKSICFPQNAYQGEYVEQIARTLFETHASKFVKPQPELIEGLPLDVCNGGDADTYIDACVAKMKSLLGENDFEAVFSFAKDTILSDISDDLGESGVTFENWFSEKAFTRTGVIDDLISQLESSGLTYEKDNALWFRSTNYGDDKDRVLRRSNGMHTYFINDLAYHVNKFERGFDVAIDIFGADHHGYIPRMKAGLEACGIDMDKMQFCLVQFVTLYRDGKQLQMSTRSGSFVTLRELREEVGGDATRFFYLMRKCGQHVDFDMDLAKAQSNENPVYYVQYAHARICSVFRQMEGRGFAWDEDSALQNLNMLTESFEKKLLTRLSQYPGILTQAANQYEPQILVGYLRELANDFHSCYNSCQFLVEDSILRNARLSLIKSVKQVLVNGLGLLRISVPEQM